MNLVELAGALSTPVPYKEITDEAGTFYVFPVPIGENGLLTLDVVKILPNRVYPPHVHDVSDGQLHFVEGHGDLLLGGGRSEPYFPGFSKTVPSGLPHGFRTGNDITIFLSLNTPPILNPTTGDVDLRYVPE